MFGSVGTPPRGAGQLHQPQATQHWDLENVGGIHTGELHFMHKKRGAWGGAATYPGSHTWET